MRAITEREAGDRPNEVALLRVPPHSIEAETAVLGALLLDTGAAWDRVADLLTDADFFRFEHRLVFEAIGGLANSNKPADVVTVFNRLQGIKGGPDVTLAYLNELAQYVPTAANIRRYAEIVREKSLLRKLVSASDEIATRAFNPGVQTAAEVVDEAESKIFAIGDLRKADDWVDSRTALTSFLDDMQAKHDARAGNTPQDFTSTGNDALDGVLNGGTRPGKVYVIAGRPGMGKTALALAIADHQTIHEGKTVAIMSMEMEQLEITQRRVAMESHVPLHKVIRPERMSDLDISEVSKAVETLAGTDVHISDKSALTLNQLRARVRGIKRRYGLHLLVIDYIGLMETEGNGKENRATGIGRISRGIKALAKDLKIAVLLLAQLNREVEKRPGQRPILSDLRESGDIEQDADVVLFVHRPIEANPDLPDEWKYYAEVIVGKNRSGPKGSVLSLGYEGSQVRFFNWTGDKPSTLAKVQAEAPAKPAKTKKLPENPL